MAISTSMCVVLNVIMLFLSAFCEGHKFNVGGKDGWVLNPSEKYNHWAERMRFQVNDTLLFKFKKEEDSVLLVTSENYNKCNVNNPIKSLTNEKSEYKFERSGPHFFISGKSDHCNQGQKLVIVVLAVRPNKPPPSPTTPAPVPGPTTPSTQSPTPSPSGEKKNSGAIYGSSLVGVVVSVVIGVGVLLA
ncbi:hypothetical protein RND81_14G026400 [Saponaria officinalis]|uniref:Phytocyanin domain-containing protein n=1 Tax=Saponaria officinalis TaxID=3572 RepID=A0AAW1GMN5_SAPOF